MKKFSLFMFVAMLFCACSMYSDPEGEAFGDAYPGTTGDNGEGGNAQEFAGKVTAGEWRDLDNWLFWSNLMTNKQADQNGTDFTSYSSYWEFYTNNRVAVRVMDEAGLPQKDVPVQLLYNNSTILYEARTDNRGETNLWIGLTQMQEMVDSTALTLVVNGEQQAQSVSVTAWGMEPLWNTFTASVTPTTNIDIAFIVDATGSMGDEINFLKADMTNIIDSVKECHGEVNIRTAAVFYRDEGDEYLTRESDFTDDLSTTASFIKMQTADGGGDYPEAVHTALEAGLQKLSWRQDNCIRLVFMLLDAPPHHEQSVIASLHKSVPLYAQKGIRIIPVAASGVDKSTEFFLRFVAIATDGTYVFLTNHSGVGNDHIIATVGEYKVELLNALITRLINQYIQ